MFKKSNFLKLASVGLLTGMLFGTQANAVHTGDQAAESPEPQTEKSGCSGKNGCSGTGSCKGENSCKGSKGDKDANACGGPGGCGAKEDATEEK